MLLFGRLARYFGRTPLTGVSLCAACSAGPPRPPALPPDFAALPAAMRLSSVAMNALAWSICFGLLVVSVRMLSAPARFLMGSGGVLDGFSQNGQRVL